MAASWFNSQFQISFDVLVYLLINKFCIIIIIIVHFFGLFPCNTTYYNINDDIILVDYFDI